MGEVSNGQARVELGDGINSTCRIVPGGAAKELVEAPAPASAKPDLSSLSSKLKAHWKGGPTVSEAKPEAVRAGQIRKFRITRLDLSARTIELELA